jgi:hypothetical protein
MATKGKSTNSTTSTNVGTPDEQIGIQEAARLVGKQAQYLHQLVLKDPSVFDAVKTYIGDTSVPKWLLSKNAVRAYFDGSEHRGVRTDGRIKWNLYATMAEMTTLKALMADYALEEVAKLITKANVLTPEQKEKRKEYMAKAKAKKTAKKPATKAYEGIAPVAEIAVASAAVVAPASSPSREARAAARLAHVGTAGK